MYTATTENDNDIYSNNNNNNKNKNNNNDNKYNNHKNNENYIHVIELCRVTKLDQFQTLFQQGWKEQ